MSHYFESPRRNGKSLFAQELIAAVRTRVQEEFTSSLSTPIKLEMTDELNAKIDTLIDALQANTDAINARNSSRGASGLLAALQAEAANDAPEPELKQLDQWVFEGQDEKWISAAVDRDGEAFLYSVRSVMLQRPRRDDCEWNAESLGEWKLLEGKFDARYWRDSNIDRQLVNDVDFDEDDDDAKALESEFLGVDPETGASVRWFGIIGDDAPSLTDADLQRVFVQNLCTTLIQRMHSLDRFSGEDEVIKGDDVLAWDAVVAIARDSYGSLVSLYGCALTDVCGGTSAFIQRTIYETEVNDWRRAMEKRYVPAD